MSGKTKLELTWIGKDHRPLLEPRILLEDPEKSYHAAQTVGANDLFDNRLIFGDNLLALKALKQEFAGKIKCVYIDPPYNTEAAFQHYDDGIEHSVWLSLIRDRLEIFRQLLTIDGSIWIQLDDNEGHYGKVLCDEIFGRSNFITDIAWHKKRGKDNSSKYFSITHDHIFVYAKEKSHFKINRIDLEETTKKAYTNPSSDLRGPYRLLGLWSRQQGGSDYAYVMKNGMKFKRRLWLVSQTTMMQLESEDRIVVRGDNLYRKLFLTENAGSIPETIWTGLSNNANAKDELKRLFPSSDSLFETPKPEPLLHRVIKIATNPGDWILDSFAGSGTTGAVAHKMGRRWIMIELGDHCHTHIIPRLTKVIDGTDLGGITEAVGWKGGGGFRYFGLALL